MAPSAAAASSARRVGCFSGWFLSPSRAHKPVFPPHDVKATLVYAGDQQPQVARVEQAPFAQPLQLDTAPVAVAVCVEADKSPAAAPGAPAAGQAEDVEDVGGGTEVPEHVVVPELQDEEASATSSSTPAAEAATKTPSITLSVQSYHSYQEMMTGGETFGRARSVKGHQMPSPSQSARSVLSVDRPRSSLSGGESGPLSSRGHSAQNTLVRVSHSSQASSRRMLAGTVPPPRLLEGDWLQRPHAPIACHMRDPRTLLASSPRDPRTLLDSSPRPLAPAKESLSLIGRIDADLQQLLECDLDHQESRELQRRRSGRAPQHEMILL